VLNTGYEQAADLFVVKDKKSVLKPIKENVAKAEKLLERYRQLETNHVKQMG
jgi:hypothetical protein